MIQTFLAFLGRRSMPLLVGGILAGLAVPPLAAALQPYVGPFVFCLTAAAMMRIELAAVWAELRRPWRLGAILVWTLVAAPLLAAATCALLRLPRGLSEAVVIWAASPPLIATTALAFLLGLDAALALVAMVLGTMLMPFTLPPLVLALVGVRLEIGLFDLMLRLTLFVGGALAVALLARRIVGAERVDRMGTEVSGLTVLFLVLFGIGVMGEAREGLVTRPLEFALFVGIAFAAATGFMAASAAAFFWMGQRQALTVGLVGGYHNMAMVWATLGSGASADLTLYFVAVQLPIYLLPPVLRPLVRALTVAKPER